MSAKANAAREHGRFRNLYESFFVDPDQQSLSDRAVRVFLALKTALPAAGIGVVLDVAMAKRCACTIDQLHAAYRELEAEKPSGEEGWIRREDGIVWVVNGLRHERSLAALNAKHARGITEALAAFSEFAIADEFRARYPEWFGGSAPTPKARQSRKTEAVTQQESHSVSHAESHSESHAGGHSQGHADTQHITETLQDSTASAVAGHAGGGGLGPVEYAVRCVVALNAGMRSNQRVRISMDVNASSQVGAVSWQEDGVDLAVAEAVIAEVCARFSPKSAKDSIKSLTYFDGPVRERWAALQASGDTDRSNWVPGARDAADNARARKLGY